MALAYWWAGLGSGLRGGIMVFLHLVSAYWWAELGLGPLVGRAVSRGSCGLRGVSGQPVC